MVYIYFHANQAQAVQINIDLRISGYVLAYNANRQQYFVTAATVADAIIIVNILGMNGVFHV